jgi:hypothetical protein
MLTITEFIAQHERARRAKEQRERDKWYARANRNNQFVTAHPESDMADLNQTFRKGWRFVAILPTGLLVFERRSWLAKVLRL